MRNFAIPLFALLTAAVFSSCDLLDGERIQGDGKIITQQRSAGAFNSLDVGGAVELHLRQEATPVVKIETDENLQSYLEVVVEGSTLKVQTKHGYHLDPTNKIVVYVAAPTFKDLEISGACELIGDGPLSGNNLELHASGASEITLDVAVEKIKADLSGSSTLTLKGTSNTVTTEASGACSVKCLNLATRETTLDLSGASKAEVSAEKQLNIDASGASEVRYRGNASINQKSSGASSVTKIS